MNRLPGLFKEVGRYGICVAVAVAADFAMLTLLVSWLGVNYIAAAVISFIAANALLYGLCTRFVFRQRAKEGLPRDLAIFIAASAVALGLQTVILIFAVQTLHAHYLVAKLGAAGFTFMINFLVRRNVLFA
jgi:putative flippase GtrA